MKLKLITESVIKVEITYDLTEEEIFEIQDEIDNEFIESELTLFLYLEDNVAEESREESLNDFEVHGYDDFIEQIKNYKND